MKFRIRPRWQKVLSDLWGNRMRSLLVLASIAVGLFASGVIAIIYFVALEDMQRGYAAINPANITVWASYFDQDLVEHMAKLPGVRQAEGSRELDVRLEAGPGKWISIHLKAMKDPAKSTVNQVRLVDGVWPPGEGEIAIDRYRLHETQANIGDWVTLELPSGKTRRFKLVGIVHDETIGARGNAGGFFSAPVQGYLDQASLASLEQPFPEKYNLLLVTITGDTNNRDHLESMAKTIRDDLEKNDVTLASSTVRSSTDHPNLYLVRAILAILLIIGLLVVFLSSFLITNTLQAIMNQQVQQIGILKTVGGRRFQIAGIYLTLSLIYGLLAYLVALPLANVVAFSTVGFLTVQLNYTFFGQRFVPQVALIQGLIAVLLPQLAALGPVLQGVRIMVQESLSGYRQSRRPGNKSRPRNPLSSAAKHLQSTSLLSIIALRNTFRHKGRLALTLITLTLGGAVFISTFNVRVSLMKYMDQIIQYFQADVNITLTRPYYTREIADLVNEVPGVAGVEGWVFARTELVLEDGSAGDNVSLLAPPAGSKLIKPIMLKGRWVEPGDQNAIALSELFLDYYPELKVGDTLRLRVNGDETDWVVVGFFQLAGKVSGLSAYTNYEYLAPMINQNGRAATFRVTSIPGEPDAMGNRPPLSLEAQQALGSAIEAHLKRYGIRVADVDTGLSLTQTASDGFNVLTAFLLFLALLTALIGSIGLAGSMGLNVMERTREIGILRAVGASNHKLMRIVLLEGVTIGLLSWALGSLAAFPISKILSDSISLALFGGTSSFGFTITGFVVWLAAVMLLSVLASVLPARSATRLTIREVLSYE